MGNREIFWFNTWETRKEHVVKSSEFAATQFWCWGGPGHLGLLAHTPFLLVMLKSWQVRWQCPLKDQWKAGLGREADSDLITSSHGPFWLTSLRIVPISGLTSKDERRESILALEFKNPELLFWKMGEQTFPWGQQRRIQQWTLNSWPSPQPVPEKG